MNIRDFYDGKAFDAYTYFGAHPADNGRGTVFRVWAPSAADVSVIGDFSGWQPVKLLQQGQSGIFAGQCDSARPGQMYKYLVTDRDGVRRERCDPYGFRMELRPKFASIIADHTPFRFDDDEWMSRRDKCYDRPLSIYEVHLGSWMKRGDGEEDWYTYDEIAPKLIAYCKEHHFTHIEFLPLAEHPCDNSWGYQITGFFSPTSRYGTPEQLKRLVSECHRAGIGVIMDFVPVHFANDDYALRRFDGTALYEYPAADVGESEWGTCNFLHSRREVACFVQSCASYWLGEFHFDGLRMDAVSRAIYWMGDSSRGVNENGVNFIRAMNSGLQKIHPTAMLIAEDSTSYPKITAPVEYGGLGFDYKWDLGWMHDTLNYMKTPPAERKKHHNKLTFSMQYFQNELFMLAFSHDEVVHGKATIIQKMWGDYEQKFPQARALYMYMFAHPGKKLNFMGNELAHFREWDEKREQDWFLLKYPLHDSFQRYFSELQELYEKLPALHIKEYDPAAFRWLEADAAEQSVYIFRRSAAGQTVVAAFNFSDKHRWYNTSAQTDFSSVRVLLCSDWQRFSGNTVEGACLVTKTTGSGLSFSLPPFSGVLCELD